MSSLDAFNEILQRDEPLAPYTWLRLGGPAQYMATPRTVEELTGLVTVCHDEQLPIHVLGGGSNLLVKDEGVSGVVIRLTAPVFGKVEIDGNFVRTGAGALLSHVISETVRIGLAGFENLAGIPGSRESAGLGISYNGKRAAARLKAIADRPLANTPTLIANEPSMAIDVAGSYSVARNIDLTAGLRYKREENNRLERLTDNRRDSQAIYIGTALRF
jgi:hypothetical protein